MTSPHDPLQLPCGRMLPNRIMKAAMSEALANAGHSPDGRLEQLYRTWSQGGYGLLINGNVMVDRTQLGEPGNVVIEDDRDRDGLTRWAKAARWKPLSALRGLVNPLLDSRMSRDLRTQAALSALDARPANDTTAESKGTR